MSRGASCGPGRTSDVARPETGHLVSSGAPRARKADVAVEILNIERSQEPITLCVPLACNGGGHRGDHLRLPLTPNGSAIAFL